MPDDQQSQDQPGLLKTIGQGLSKALPYALDIGLGAAAGGPIGAAAGLAKGLGSSTVDPYQMAQLGMEGRRLGLEAQQVQQTGELKKAELQSQQDYHSEMEQDRHDQLAARTAEWNQNFLLHEDSAQALKDYRQGQQMLEQENSAIRATLGQSMIEDRRDRLNQQLQENTRSRIAGYQTLAQHAAEHASDHRGFWSKWFGDTSKMSDDEFGEAVRDKTLVDSLKQSGISRDDMLNAGVAPDVVDKVYPAPKSLTAKKGGVAAPSTSDKGSDFSLPTDIKTTSAAVRWLQVNKKMSRDDAISWVKTHGAE